MNILPTFNLKLGKVTICVMIGFIGLILLIVAFSRKSHHKSHGIYMSVGIVFILLSVGLFYMFHKHIGVDKLFSKRRDEIKDHAHALQDHLDSSKDKTSSKDETGKFKMPEFLSNCPTWFTEEEKEKARSRKECR